MKRLKANRHILHVLKNANPRLRKTIIKESTPEVIKTLCEICQNTLNGNAKISLPTKNRLKKYKKTIRNLMSPKLNLSSKRKILIQKGGFLPILLASLLSGAIGKLIDSV